MPRRIWIDCGEGFRHEAAIRMAFEEPDVEIAALTAVFGKISCSQCYEELKELAGSLEPKIQTGIGADRPLMRRTACLSIPGGEGPCSDGYVSDGEPIAYAWDILYEEARKSREGLTVVTLGALTNLAIALFKYEDLPRYLTRIVMLGGSMGAGDVCSFGEENVVRDPHACAAVLASGISVCMVGLDVTESLGRAKDAAAMMTALAPETAVCGRYTVEVDTVPGEMYGRTIVDQRTHMAPEGNVEVAERIHREACIRRWEKALETCKGETKG